MVLLKLQPFGILVASNIVVALKTLLRHNKMTMLVAARMPNGLGFRTFLLLKQITVREL